MCAGANGDAYVKALMLATCRQPLDRVPTSRMHIRHHVAMLSDEQAVPTATVTHGTITSCQSPLVSFPVMFVPSQRWVFQVAKAGIKLSALASSFGSSYHTSFEGIDTCSLRCASSPNSKAGGPYQLGSHFRNACNVHGAVSLVGASGYVEAMQK